MDKMTSHERYSRIFAHKEADRIPFCDSPWGETIERWHKEGLPKGVSWADYFGFDKVATITTDNTPRYLIQTIEETDEYIIQTTAWGCTAKNFKHTASTPEFLNYKVVDRESWKDCKARMTITRDRVNWDYLKANYKKWR